MKEKLIMLCVKLLTVGVTLISPELKAYIQSNLVEWEERAKLTKNPFDDLFIGLLKTLFS